MRKSISSLLHGGRHIYCPLCDDDLPAINVCVSSAQRSLRSHFAASHRGSLGLLSVSSACHSTLWGSLPIHQRAMPHERKIVPYAMKRRGEFGARSVQTVVDSYVGLVRSRATQHFVFLDFANLPHIFKWWHEVDPFADEFLSLPERPIFIAFTEPGVKSGHVSDSIVGRVLHQHRRLLIHCVHGGQEAADLVMVDMVSRLTHLFPATSMSMGAHLHISMLTGDKRHTKGVTSVAPASQFNGVTCVWDDDRNDDPAIGRAAILDLLVFLKERRCLSPRPIMQ